MSKKKVTANTMTLKDFHGGSIPSDLPLPSAPGVTIRPSDRPPYDRPVSWSSPMGVSDHKSRQHSQPQTRKLDDKASLFASTMQIGRNFDEDERKPLDSGLTQRRTINDENFRIGNTHAESKTAYGVTGGQELAQVTKFSSSGAPNSYLGRVVEASVVNAQNLCNHGRENSSGVYPNAWAARKEKVTGVTESVPSVVVGGTAISKLAQASALEKVSSGRWQSKQSLNHPGDINFRISESHSDQKVDGCGNNTFKSFASLNQRENVDSSLATKGPGLDDEIKDGQESPDCEKVVAQKYVAARESNPSEIETYGIQQSYNDRKLGKYELQKQMTSEPPEPPKLKLLPRTKQLESMEPISTNYTQVAADTYSTETLEEVHGNTTLVKQNFSLVESAKLAAERPKLNLKPRSQLAEQFEGSFTDRDRSALFGGARPRELVLKDRGGIAANNSDIIPNPDRVEPSVTMTERFQGQRVPSHNTPKKAEADVDKADSLTLRRNGGHENRRNNRETERRQQQQQQKLQLDRLPSPETWRKPVEEPKLASSDEGLRFGKVASATELAQAFSKSVSTPNSLDRQAGQRNSLPGRNQVPFSRLTGPSPTTQINGY